MRTPSPKLKAKSIQINADCDRSHGSKSCKCGIKSITSKGSQQLILLIDGNEEVGSFHLQKRVLLLSELHVADQTGHLLKASDHFADQLRKARSDPATTSRYLLNHLSLIHYKDQICIANGAQAMCNDHLCTTTTGRWRSVWIRFRRQGRLLRRNRDARIAYKALANSSL